MNLKKRYIFIIIKRKTRYYDLGFSFSLQVTEFKIFYFKKKKKNSVNRFIKNKNNNKY